MDFNKLLKSLLTATILISIALSLLLVTIYFANIYGPFVYAITLGLVFFVSIVHDAYTKL